MNTTEIVSPYLGPARPWSFKIAGGVFVPIEHVPFQGYLVDSDNNVLCGASILSSLVILTAAHCFVNQRISSIAFVAGDTRRSTWEGAEQRRSISSVNIHEGYEKRTTFSEHDIAVAFLSWPLTITDHVKTIGVGSSLTRSNGNALLSGYGWTRYHGSASDEVQAAVVPLVSLAECNRMWNQYKPFTENVLCTFNPGVSVCPGDSGGALSGYVDGKLIVVGVVVASQGCKGVNNKPGIYANVSWYASWIRAKIAAMCTSDQVLCSPYSAKCISKNWLCDGDNDCGNNKDESNCNLHKKRGTCGRDKMWCPNSSKCIKNTWICDGDNDCGNNEDEVNCRVFGTQSQCEKGQFWCKSSSKCITMDYLCDGDNDCGDNEDENFCTFH